MPQHTYQADAVLFRFRYHDGVPYYKTTALLDSKVYSALYRIFLFLLVQYVVPMFALSILNWRVVHCLRKADIHSPHESYPIVINLRRMNPSESHATSSRRSSISNGLTSTSAPTRGASAASPGVAPSSESPSGVTVMSPAPLPDARLNSTCVTYPRNTTRNVTTMVVVVVTLCIVCHSISTVAHVVWSVQITFYAANQYPRLDIVRRHLANVSNVLMTLNSAANFIIYCACSRNFRMVLWRMVHKLIPCSCRGTERQRSLVSVEGNQRNQMKSFRRIDSKSSNVLTANQWRTL